MMKVHLFVDIKINRQVENTDSARYCSRAVVNVVNERNHVGRNICRYKDMYFCRWIDIQIDRKIDRQSVRQKDR